MSMTRFSACIAALALMALSNSATLGQSYPAKPIRFIAAEAGGGSDILARLIAHHSSASLGQNIIVDNRLGSPIIPAQVVAKSAPDGYTLLVHGSAIWILPLLQDNALYDPVSDFAPVTLAVSSPNILGAHPSLPVNSVKELIALAKSKPGELNYGTAGNGSSTHLSAELFKAMAKINVVRISYKGIGSALNDLIAGQVQFMFANANVVMPQVKSGRLRALAVTSLQPSALLPDLPTAAATGLPGYESATVSGVFAPGKTPTAIISRLNQEIVRVLNIAEVKERLFSMGTEVVASSPEGFAAARKADMARMGKVIQDAGIRGE